MRFYALITIGLLAGVLTVFLLGGGVKVAKDLKAEMDKPQLSVMEMAERAAR